MLSGVVYSIPNPAAVYCEELGYEYKNGKCKINNKEYNGWDFYKGKVGKEFSYCNKKGYEIKTKVVDKESYTEEFAVCITKDKKEKPLKDVMEEDGISLTKEEKKGEKKKKDTKNVDVNTSKTLPSIFDWRNKDGRTYIGGVRDQGSCGNCYAFSALAAAEGTYNWATKKYDGNCADFSEAFLSFCLSDNYSNFDGCSGAGYEYQELDALVDDGMGICDESVFPYDTSWSTSNEPTCLSSYWDAPRVEFGKWARISTLDIESMKKALMTYGVLDVAVNAKPSFESYSGGIFTDSQTTCPLGAYTATNHGVSLVGRGYDETYGDYWILRNSWSPFWGENGYMRIAATSARVACAPTFIQLTNETLEPYSISPTSPTNVTKDQLFDFSTGVTCIDGYCGDVSATLSILDPEVEIYYDDGIATTLWSDSNFIWAVRFTAPSYPSVISKAKLQFYDPYALGSYTATVHVYEDNSGVPGNDLIIPFTTTIDVFYPHWDWVDLNVSINGDFWIGISAPGDALGPYALVDSGTTTSRSLGGDGSTWYYLGGDLLIRAFVNEGRGIIPINNEIPFYTIDDNPTICYNMGDGDSCNTTWMVNATGDINSSYNFFTIYESIQYPISPAETNKVNITIVELLYEIFSINLLEGWNLISVPLKLNNNSLGYALSSIEGNYGTVFSYGSWEQLDSDSIVNETIGLWVKMLVEDNLTINGVLPVNPLFNLKQGYNLIGYPSLEEKNISHVFADVSDNLINVWMYENYTWKSFDPKKTLNTIETVKPGFGYWVKVNESVSWTFNETFK